MLPTPSGWGRGGGGKQPINIEDSRTSMAFLASRAAWSGAAWTTRNRGKTPEIIPPKKAKTLAQRQKKTNYISHEYATTEQLQEAEELDLTKARRQRIHFPSPFPRKENNCSNWQETHTLFGQVWECLTVKFLNIATCYTFCMQPNFDAHKQHWDTYVS